MCQLSACPCCVAGAGSAEETGGRHVTERNTSAYIAATDPGDLPCLWFVKDQLGFLAVCVCVCVCVCVNVVCVCVCCTCLCVCVAGFTVFSAGDSCDIQLKIV